MAAGPQHLWELLGLGTYGCPCGLKVSAFAVGLPPTNSGTCTHIWVETPKLETYKCTGCRSNLKSSKAEYCLKKGHHCHHTWETQYISTEGNELECTLCASSVTLAHQVITPPGHYATTKKKGNLPPSPVAISSPEMSHPWPNYLYRLDLLAAAEKNGHEMKHLEYTTYSKNIAYWAVYCTHCHSCYIESNVGYHESQGWDKFYDIAGSVDTISKKIGIDLWWEPNDLNLSTLKCSNS